jgi:hypothetical protein
MRRTASWCMALASLFVLAVPGNVTAAAIIDHFHERFSDSFPNTEICGIVGTSVISGVQNVTRFSDGTFIDNATFTETFTATASQKSIVIQSSNSFTRRSVPIDNGDGTFTFIVTFKGLHEQIRIANGPVLSFDAGTITFANTFAIDEDGNGTFVSSTIVGLHGLHPEALSDGTLFCDVVVPALT